MYPQTLDVFAKSGKAVLKKRFSRLERRKKQKHARNDGQRDIKACFHQFAFFRQHPDIQSERRKCR